MVRENGPVTSSVDLTLLAEHHRGHGALYDALNRGHIDTGRLRHARPAPTLKEYAAASPQGGRPPKHGAEFRFANPALGASPTPRRCRSSTGTAS